MRKWLTELRGKGVTDVETLAKAIVDYRQLFVSDDTRVVSFNDRLKVKLVGKNQETKKAPLPKSAQAGSASMSVEMNVQQEDLPTTETPEKVLTELEAILASEQLKRSRYYQASQTEEDYERTVKERPQDVNVWIAYAISVLPSLKYEDYENMQAAKLDRALNILARALAQNRLEEKIWTLYLELYNRRVSYDRKRVEEALTYLPFSLAIWWKWVSWESSERKEEVLLAMLKVFTAEEAKNALGE